MREEKHHLLVEGALIVVLAMAMGAGCSSKKKVADVDTTTRGVASEPAPAQPAPVAEEHETPTAHFAFDSDRLDFTARDIVMERSRFLKDNPDHTAVIIGGCDERGSDAYNYRLGLRRANSVKNLLVRDGVEAARIQVRSVGKSEPIATGHDEESWAQNRRAEIHVNPPDRMALQ